jgi:hypothetical protein
MLGGGATKHQGVIPVTTGKKITTKAQSKDLLSSLFFLIEIKMLGSQHNKAISMAGGL